VLVIEHLAPGGQVATVEKIRNFPGFAEGVGGYELGPLLQQQAEERGVDFLFDSVERLEPDEHGFRIVGAEETVHARAVIVAAGSHRRTLGVPGEQEFEGRGVSHCASCDAHFFRGKQVVVVGGGDSAFDEAEILAEHAGAVTIIHRGPRPVAQQRSVERVSALANVHLVGDAEVTAIEGADGVDRVLIDTPDGQGARDCAGVFVYTGLVPNSAFLGDLVALDATGAIVTGGSFESSRPGLFAAGDIRSGAAAMLASVAGEGASAALAAVRYLRERATTGMF
jgi:thioredoxin reductase (NADPH)